MQLLLANRRLIGYLIVIIAIIGVGWYLRWDGYRDGVNDTTQIYEQRMQAERVRLEEANRLALEEAERRLGLLLTAIRSRNEEVERLRLEAENDPNASDGAFSSDSVRRINRVR